MNISNMNLGQRAKVLEKKIKEIQTILNKEGGTTTLEMIAILEYIKLSLVSQYKTQEAMKAMRIAELGQQVKKSPRGYN